MASPPTKSLLSRADAMVTTGLLFGVGVALTMVGAWGYPPLYDLPAGLDWRIAAAILLLLVVLIGAILRAHGQPLMLLLAYGVFLVPTALGLEVGGALTLNGVLDRGETTHHAAPVLGARGVRSSTGPGTPYKLIQVESWTAGEPDPWISVDGDLYESVVPGESSLGVVTKPGRLGIEWIVDVHPEPEEGTES